MPNLIVAIVPDIDRRQNAETWPPGRHRHHDRRERVHKLKQMRTAMTCR
jgi:hypothetical protein